MPENWKKYRLGDLIEVNKNLIRKGDLDWINYIDIKSVGTGFYEEPKRMNFEDAPSRARRLLKEGDTVISSVRPNLKSYFYSQNLKENSIASTGFAVLSPKNIDKRFLYYLTTNDNYINYLVQSCTGSAYPAFGPQVLLDSEVLIPESIQEQKSIASILSALDDKIELNLQMNKTLEEMAMALYKHWFVDFGPFQDGEFVDSDLGEIPKGWEVKPIKDFLSIKPINGLYKKKKFQGRGNRWLKMKSVYGLPYILDQEMELISVTAQEQEKYGCMFNDLVFGRTSLVLEGIGTCAIIKTTTDAPIFESNLFRLRVDPNLFDPNVLYLFFKSKKGREEVKKIARQTAAVSITSRDLTEIKIPIPPAGSEYLNENIDNIFSQIINNLMENSCLTQLRDTLLPKLISGEVRVKDVEKTLSEVL